MSVGSGNFYPFGDANGSIPDRILAASHALTSAQSMLDTALSKVGYHIAYSGADPKVELKGAIEMYARAAARYEMLCILQSEDFYVAMARSAAAVQS